MAQSQSLEVQEKKELSPKEEKTVPARYYIPNADIYETEDALLVVMELPGVDKKNLEINLENDVLHIEGRIDFSKYDGLDPLYTEYNVGHYSRAFSLSGSCHWSSSSRTCKRIARIRVSSPTLAFSLVSLRCRTDHALEGSSAVEIVCR